MDMNEVKVYEPGLGLDGTVPELVDKANRYTNDYKDAALERLSELAKSFGLAEKYIRIPLLLLNERKYEDLSTEEAGQKLYSAYARLQIDHLLGDKISLCMSNYGEEGTELEIREEDDKVLVSLMGVDPEGASWHAANAYSVEEFMSNEEDWLDVAIGQTLAYGFEYDEEAE